MTIRLFSAPWSCSVSASAWVTFRSCRIAIVATSASACTTRTSSGSKRELMVPNRFSAPMVSSRSLIGKACTDWNPASMARREKVGQRSMA